MDEQSRYRRRPLTMYSFCSGSRYSAIFPRALFTIEMRVSYRVPAVLTARTVFEGKISTHLKAIPLTSGSLSPNPLPVTSNNPSKNPPPAASFPIPPEGDIPLAKVFSATVSRILYSMKIPISLCAGLGERVWEERKGRSSGQPEPKRAGEVDVEGEEREDGESSKSEMAERARARECRTSLL